MASQEVPEGSVLGDEDGRSSIGRRLAHLAVALHGADSLDAVLDQVVRVAAEVVPGCDGASITFRDGDRLWTPTATDERATAFDELQYGLGEGPCLDALERPIVAADGTNWDEWPAFHAAVPDDLALVSCGLLALARPAGALNLYGRQRFDDDSKEIALLLAAHASVGVAALLARLAGAVADDTNRMARALGEMLDHAHHVLPDRLPDLGQQVARLCGARTTRVWLADYSQRWLLPLGQPPGVEGLDIDGTVGGRAFLLGEAVELVHDDAAVVWMPLVNGVDRLGVVQFELDRTDDWRRGTLSKIAELLASEIVTRGQYTDAVPVARRAQELTLAAEFQWNLLRPPAFATGDVTVAAAVEPAYSVGGDGYDYAYNQDVLHAAVFDAMGHDLDASMISNLLVAVLRWCRRRNTDLQATAATVDTVINQRFPEARYATAVLAELDVVTGVLQWINCGHPPPILIREGRVIGPLLSPPAPPLGLAACLGRPVGSVSEAALQRGDRVLLYTDGLVEARMAGGDDFGLDRLHESLHRALASGLSASEIVRRLAHAVVDHHGAALRDDASIFLLQWHPGGGAARPSD